MADHGHDAEFPTIWFILDEQGHRIGESVQMTLELAKVDAGNRFGKKAVLVINSGKRKPPNKCCNRCGDKPCS
jgi:hypothetical protein